MKSKLAAKPLRNRTIHVEDLKELDEMICTARGLVRELEGLGQYGTAAGIEEYFREYASLCDDLEEEAEKLQEAEDNYISNLRCV